MIKLFFFFLKGSEVPDVNTYATCCDVKNQLSKFAEILKATEFYKLYYFHPFCKGAMCLMMCVPMASKLVINGNLLRLFCMDSLLLLAFITHSSFVFDLSDC